MSTIRAQILAAVDTALASASADVYQDYDAAGADVAGGILFGDWHDVTEEVGMVDAHTLTLPLGVFARGATADADADALHAEVVGLLMADRSFGGLVRKLDAGPVSGRRDATGGKNVQISQTFTLRYMTERGSLTVAA
jgi:hypothetical protein